MPRTITLAASLPATPHRLYDMYLDPEQHSAFTGARSRSRPSPVPSFRPSTGPFPARSCTSSQNGSSSRNGDSVNFPAEAIDSILVLTFWPEGKGTRIELVHVNVPEEDFAGISEGWVKFYWNPWRAYLTGSAHA